MGHLAAALAAKRVDPEVPLAAGVAAALALDLVWPILLLAGVEGILALPVIPSLVAFANVPFGADALAWNFWAQTTAEPAPLGAARVVMVTQRDGDDDDRGDLSHTVYDDPPAMRVILSHVHTP